MQTTRQQFPILKFEWAAINFQLLQTVLFNQCETTVFRKIIALLSLAHIVSESRNMSYLLGRMFFCLDRW
jgi:hypothetical protein